MKTAGDKFIKGDSLKVIDGKKAYSCKVVGVKQDRIKVHYIGWRKTRDEWLAVDSDRILPDDISVDSGSE